MEGQKLNLGKFLLGFTHNGKLAMGIELHIAMPGKMFESSKNIGLTIPLKGKGAQGGHLFSRRAKGSLTNDRIFRIHIDIDTGGKIDVHPHSAQLLPSHKSRLANQLGTFSLRHLKIARESGKSFDQPVVVTSLLIDPNEQRNFG